MPLLLLSGVANVWFFIPFATILQRQSSDELRGRVMAVRQMLTRIATVIGFIGAGALAEGVGLDLTIVMLAAVVMLAAIVGWSRPALHAT